MKVLIYGGKGGLGSVLVSHFKAKGCWVVSVDLHANDEADKNVLVNPSDDWLKQESFILEQVSSLMQSGSVFDSILNMAGTIVAQQPLFNSL